MPLVLCWETLGNWQFLVKSYSQRKKIKHNCLWRPIVLSQYQFSSVAQSCLTLQPHESQHARPACPSPTPGVHSDSRPSSHLTLGHPLLLLPSIPPSIRVFSNGSTLRMRWLKYWSFSFSIIPSKEIQGWSPSEQTGWISLQSKGLSRVFSNTTVQKHQFFGN